MFDITGFKFSPVCCDMEAPAGSTQGKCFQIFDHWLFLPHPIPDTHPTKWNPALLTNNSQGWLFNLSKISSLAAYWFAFLWKTSCLYVGSEEEVRQELGTRTRQDLSWDRETLFSMEVKILNQVELGLASWFPTLSMIFCMALVINLIQILS